jgi:outer membrane immunogenic protein
MLNRLIKFGCVAAAVAMCSSAVADGLPRPGLKDVGPAPFSWTGFYAGVHLGHGWSNDEISFSGSPATAALFAANEFPRRLDGKANGWLAGAQAGHNWQVGLLVLGVEADISWSDVDGGSSASPVPTGGLFVQFRTNAERSLDWFGTIRGRLGITGGPWLIYGTGGWAYGETSVSYSTVPTAFACGPGFTCSSASTDRRASGWAAGAGIEYALSWNWMIRAEYLHLKFDELSASAGSTAACTAFGGPCVFAARTNFDVDIVRFALNYKF